MNMSYVSNRDIRRRESFEDLEWQQETLEQNRQRDVYQRAPRKQPINLSANEWMINELF